MQKNESGFGDGEKAVEVEDKAINHTLLSAAVCVPIAGLGFGLVLRETCRDVLAKRLR